jgi:hypothetical protein
MELFASSEGLLLDPVYTSKGAPGSLIIAGVVNLRKLIACSSGIRGTDDTPLSLVLCASCFVLCPLRRVFLRLHFVCDDENSTKYKARSTSSKYKDQSTKIKVQSSMSSRTNLW